MQNQFCRRQTDKTARDFQMTVNEQATTKASGPWRRRVTRATLTVSSAAFLAVTSAPMPAAADGMLVPICTNGAITYILMSFEDGNETPGHDRPGAPCHGPCLHERKRPNAALKAAL